MTKYNDEYHIVTMHKGYCYLSKDVVTPEANTEQLVKELMRVHLKEKHNGGN